MFRMHFVGGVFGVGKSTLCAQVAQRIGAEHRKASELIRFQPITDDPTGKAVKSIDANQAKLISAVNGLRAAGRVLILDGHFSLLSTTHEVVTVDVAVFRELSPQSMVLLESTPTEIAERLSARDGIELAPSLIERLIEQERIHSQHIASALAVPLLVTSGGAASDEIAQFLASVD